jgi:Ca2+/Na+ antiporter
VYVVYVCTVIGMYFSSKRSRKIKIENEIENAATGNTEIELSSVYRQNGVTDVQPNFSIVDTAEEERKEEVGEVEDVEVVTQNNGNSCLTNLAVVRDFTLDCLEKAVAALIPSLTPVPYPCRSTAVCLCMMCASEKARAREREKERERLKNREQEKIEKEFLLDSSGANNINNSISNDDSNNHNKNKNNNNKNDNVNNKDRFSINIDDINNNNNNNNTEDDLGLSTIDINIADTPTSAFNKNENKRAWEVQNPLHEKNTKNSQNNNSNDNTDNDNNNNTYSDEAYAYPNSYVPLWRAVACLLVCLFYVGLLASAIVQLCEKLSHLVGVGGSTVGATLVALGSEVRTSYRTDTCVCFRLGFFFFVIMIIIFFYLYYTFYFHFSLSLIFLIPSSPHTPILS